MAIKWDDIVHGAAGAADEVLFGAPEWLLKNLGDRKAVQAWIDKNPQAYKTGETIGTIGGALIPMGGLARGVGLGAKALKGAKAAETGLELAKGAGTLGKLAEGANIAGRVGEAAKGAGALSDIGRMAAKSAGLGALESGARGAFDEESGDQISKDVSQGLLFGGLGGAASGAIGKMASPLLDRLQKGTAQKYLASRGINTRSLKKAFNESMPAGAKENYKVQEAGKYLRGVTDYTKKIPRAEGAIEKLAEKTDEMYDVLDDAWKMRYGQIEAPKVIDAVLDNVADMGAIAEEFGPEAAKAARDLLVSQASGKMGLRQMKSFLDRAYDNARTNPKISENWALSGALQSMASKMKSGLDDMAVKVAEEAGNPAINIGELKKSYKLSKPLKIAQAAGDLTTAKPGGGSNTFDKIQASQLISPIVGGAIGGVGGAVATPEEAGDKLKNTLLASLAGAALMKGASSLGSRAIGALDTPIAKLAAKVTPEVAEAAAPKLATMGGRLAANTANAVEAANPTTEPELEAAKAGAEAGQATPKEYMGLVLNRLKQYAASEGIAEDSPDFEDFVNYVGQNTMGDEGPFDAKKLAGILYPDPDERSKFVKALDVSRGLKSSLGSALRPATGVLGIGEDLGARMERDTALDKLTALVGDVAKATGTEKVAKANLQRILSARGLSQAAKKEMIRGLLEGYGIDFDTLARVGINV